MPASAPKVPPLNPPDPEATATRGLLRRLGEKAALLTSHRVLRNVGWNWAGFAVNVIAGFVVAPFLVRTMGDTGYGLWVLISSLTSYFTFLDLGVRSSVGRSLAMADATSDPRAASETLSSAIAGTSAAAAVAALGIVGLQAGFVRFFTVPAEVEADVRIALAVAGLTLALSLPLQVFDGALWGQQRFDTINAIDIPASVLRVGLTFLAVRSQDDLVPLALVNLIVTVAAGGLKAAVCFAHRPEWRLGRRYVLWTSMRSLYGFGASIFLISVAQLTRARLAPLIVGRIVGLSAVTPFSIARRLHEYAAGGTVSATGVITPVATRLYAQRSLVDLRQLFVHGCALATYAAIIIGAFFVALGPSFIELWVGPRIAAIAGPLVVILALGESVSTAQQVAGNTLIASARLRPLVMVGAVDVALLVTVGAWAAARHGLIGICLWLSLSQAITSIVVVDLARRKQEVAAVDYAKSSLAAPLLAASGPVTGLVVIVLLWPPVHWIGFVLESTAYALAAALSCWFFMWPRVVELKQARLARL